MARGCNLKEYHKGAGMVLGLTHVDRFDELHCTCQPVINKQHGTVMADLFGARQVLIYTVGIYGY